MQAGETKTVAVDLSYDSFAVWDRDMRFTVEEGNIEIYVGGDSQRYETLKFVISAA